ncbi:MAG: hypothetical protein HFE64_04335 [Lachnospiraceae bacterium]|jgi:hypothetical protein|nr:hypothetical protein [Lachnospiraceae bacterium]
MKREELHRNRIPKKKGTKLYSHAVYPFCHFFQIGGAILVLMLILGSQYIFPSSASEQLHSFVKKELTSTIELPSKEWSGSLKELFFPK